jgi:putative transcriptional regulator
MASAAFKKIMAGFEEALDHASGVPTAGRTTRVNVADVDVAKLRAKLGLSQAEFALGFEVPLGTVQGWEQGRRKPGGPARVLLTLIERDPGRVMGLLWPKTKAKPRLKPKARARGGEEAR